MVRVEHALPVLNKAEVLVEWLIGSLGRDGKRCVTLRATSWSLILVHRFREEKNG